MSRRQVHLEEVVTGLFRHCKPCMATFKATGINPQLHFECKCIYLPLNFQ